MLGAKGIAFRYRDYRQNPLDADEIRSVLGKLGLAARDVLRAGDASRAGLDGSEDEAILIARMAEQPTLLQRPIGVLGQRAVLGRPPENLLGLTEHLRTPGRLKGKIEIADDFDAPLPRAKAEAFRGEAANRGDPRR